MLRCVYEALVIGILSAFLLAACARPEAQADLTMTLDTDELDWIGTQVFRNECAGREACLVHWNEGEAFPSLGIGHFIWYPSGIEVRFVESFPALIDHMTEQGVALPDWLGNLEPFDAPWPDRSAFLDVVDAPEVAELRAFLSDTREFQADFIVLRARDSLRGVVEAAPTAARPRVRQRLEALVKTPGGVYAVTDYVNFKGEGLSPDERYHGEGWGLLQVLMAMDDEDQQPALERFRAAAAEVLTRRTENADKPIERERWLPGWLKRLETYREPARR